MGFVVAPGDFRVGNSHAMGNRRAADVMSESQNEQSEYCQSIQQIFSVMPNDTFNAVTKQS